MRRPASLCAVIVIALAVVTAPTAVAATADDVASIHTTATDFQNADTLDQVSVSGSGTSASVTFTGNASYNVVDDSGDGDADVSSTVLVGDSLNDESFSTELRLDPTESVDTDTVDVHISQTSGSDYGATVDVYAVNEAPDGTTGEGTLVKSGWDPDWQTGTQSIQLDTNVVMGAGETWTLEFVVNGTDNDGTEDSISIDGDGDSNLNDWKWDSVFGFSDIGGNVTIRGTVENGTGTYISDTHDAEKVERAFTNLSLQNAEATVTWQYYDGNQWVDQSTKTYTSGGNKSVSWSTPSASTGQWRVNVTFTATSGTTTAEVHDEGVQFDARPPDLDNSTASPSGGTNLTDSTVDLQIDVNDSDFATSQGDTVTVTYYTKAPSDNSFSKAGTTTLSQNGTATLTTTFDKGGDWQWYAAVEDSYGEQGTDSATFDFTVPATLEIREETPDHKKLDSATVRLVFYEDESATPTIVNRTVSNGEVDLSGLPVGSTFTITVDADNYHNRTVRLNSIYEQSTIFMLNTSTSSVETTFNVDDSTGDFPPGNSTELIVQRAVNDSVYDSNGDGYNWTAIAGDNLGADQSITVDLQQDQRYRLVVKNDAGDVRILGAYTAETGGIQNLRIGSVVAVPQDPGEEYRYNVTRTNASGTVTIAVEYNDTTSNTSTLYVEIYNRSDPSDKLFANTSYSNLGTLALNETVPNGEEDTEWIVKLTIQRNGGQEQVLIPVGPKQPILQDMPGWMVPIISLGSLFVVGGLFSQVNGDVGAIVLASMGGLFWYVDMMPAETGIGVVVLALIAAALLFVNERRAGGGL